MSDNKYDKNKKNDDDVTSISTLLGHITINSELRNESFIDWVKDVISKDDGKEDK